MAPLRPDDVRRGTPKHAGLSRENTGKIGAAFTACAPLLEFSF
jgi:hypothetical protein